MSSSRSPNTRETESKTITSNKLIQKIKLLTNDKKIISFDNSRCNYYGKITFNIQNGEIINTVKEESVK